MKKLAFLSFILLLLSCGNKEDQKTPEKEESKPLLSVVKEHQRAESVDPSFAKDIENWRELSMLNSFVNRLHKVSSNEILSNALELRDLVKALKDSVTPRVFNVAPFKARVHVLNTEALRLADLTFIPAIKANEVHVQLDKTIAAFSALNTSVNTILSKKRFEDEIDIDLDFIGIDDSKMDSVSIKSIENTKKELPTKVLNNNIQPVSKKPKQPAKK